MTHKTTQTSTLLLLTVLSALIFMAACKKTDTPAPVTIVGTWIPTSEKLDSVQGSVTLKDTTFVLNGANLGYTSIQFTSTGQAILAFYPTGLDTVTYTWAGGLLNIITGGPSTPMPATLTATTLSVINSDTTSTSPLTILTTTRIFTKQ